MVEVVTREPEFGRLISKVEAIQALNWYHTAYSSKDPKIQNWVPEWMEGAGYSPEDIDRYKSANCPDKTPSKAFLARMAHLGAMVEDPDYFNGVLRKHVAHVFEWKPAAGGFLDNVDFEAPVKVPKKGAAANTDMSLLADIDSVIDQFVDSEYARIPDIRALLQPRAPAETKAAMAYLQGLMDEIGGKGKQRSEAYDHLKKMQREKYLKLVASIYDGINDRQQAIKDKISKKIRAMNRKTPEQIVSKLKFNPGEGLLKSINPVDILGAQALIVYNLKANQVIVLMAETEEGLNVHKMSITGFDKKKSTSRKIGNNTEVLTGLMNCGIKRINHQFTGLDTKVTVPHGKLNENYVILRAFK